MHLIPRRRRACRVFIRRSNGKWFWVRSISLSAHSGEPLTRANWTITHPLVVRSCTSAQPWVTRSTRGTWGWPGWAPGITSKLFERNGADRGRPGEAINRTHPWPRTTWTWEGALHMTLLVIKGRADSKIKVTIDWQTFWGNLFVSLN